MRIKDSIICSLGDTPITLTELSEIVKKSFDPLEFSTSFAPAFMTLCDDGIVNKRPVELGERKGRINKRMIMCSLSAEGKKRKKTIMNDPNRSLLHPPICRSILR